MTPEQIAASFARVYKAGQNGLKARGHIAGQRAPLIQTADPLARERVQELTIARGQRLLVLLAGQPDGRATAKLLRRGLKGSQNYASDAMNWAHAAGYIAHVYQGGQSRAREITEAGRHYLTSLGLAPANPLAAALGLVKES